MDATRHYHTNWSQADRERQIPYDITYMGNLKYGRNEPIHETEIDSQTQIKLVIAGGVGERGTGSLGLVDANSYR